MSVNIAAMNFHDHFFLITHCYFEIYGALTNEKFVRSDNFKNFILGYMCSIVIFSSTLFF